MIVDYDTLDLTGSKSTHKRTLQYRVFVDNQIIKFGEPLFIDNLVITNKTTGKALVKDTDYIIPTNTDTTGLYAHDAVSLAKLEAISAGTTFSKDLILGITLKSTSSIKIECTIEVSGQALFMRPVDYNTTNSNDAGPDYSRNLMKSVLEELHRLNTAKQNVPTENPTVEYTKFNIIDIDLTGEASTNFITEQHEADTTSETGNFIIRPKYGSFYDNDKLIVKLGETVLTKNTDYQIKGINRAKTRVAKCKYAVYEYIVLAPNLKGTLTIQYQAFGGEATNDDILNLNSQLDAITESINSDKYITKINIRNNSIINELFDRITKLEDSAKFDSLMHYRYYYDYLTYNNNTKYAKPLWIDVAKLSIPSFNSSETTDDDFATLPKDYTETFKLTCDDLAHSETVSDTNYIVRELHYYAMFDVHYNIDSNLLELKNVKIAQSTIDENGINYYSQKITPIFRLVYDKLNLDHGVVLQMSIQSNRGFEKTLSNLIYNTFCLEKMAGSKSAWSLSELDINKTHNSTNNITLPSGDIIDIDDDDTVSLGPTTLDDTFTIFKGAINISDIDTVSLTEGATYSDSEGKIDQPRWVDNTTGYVFDPVIINEAFRIDQIKGFKFKIYDRHTTQYITSYVDTNISNDTIIGNSMYYPDDLCAIRCQLTHIDDTTVYKYSGNIFTSTGSRSKVDNRFWLRQIDVILS